MKTNSYKDIQNMSSQLKQKGGTKINRHEFRKISQTTKANQFFVIFVNNLRLIPNFKQSIKVLGINLTIICCIT